MLFGMVIITSLAVSMLAAVAVDAAYQACSRTVRSRGRTPRADPEDSWICPICMTGSQGGA